MKRLTKKEEIDILVLLINKKLLSRGSSRAVYELNDSEVVKIAFDDNAKNQNANEIKLYKEENQNLPLAEIIAYGENVIIMEKVDVLDNDDVGYIYDCYYDNEESGLFDPTIEEEIVVAIDSLNAFIGGTSDNFQIGFNQNDKIVSYDYGYFVNPEEEDYIIENLVTINLSHYLNTQKNSIEKIIEKLGN